MNSDNINQQKNAILFAQLLLNLHGAAMTALGKLIDPQTGKTERDLDQARAIIDTMSMLRAKCQGNLELDEERFFDQMLAELRLNFVDEAARANVTPPESLNKNTEDTPS